MLTVLILGGIRILARWFFKDENLFINEKKSNVIIYGAGSAGRELSQALKLSRDYHHIAFIDDKLSNEKANINNIPVFTSNNIESLIKKFEVNEVFLALTSTSRKKRNSIIDKLSPLPVRVKSLPSFSEIAEGKVKVDDLLDIDIRDLLGREPVEANKKLLKTNITNKVVMVTGAGGSIGSELSRQISLLRPKLLILFEQSESSLYHIEQELLNSNNWNNKIISILGSIRDRIRLESIFKKFKVQTIYHAAAYKHVPLVEFNTSEGVLNNSIGSMVIAESAMNANVETFVLISTDKAVRPTNTMGASKRVAELILQALSKKSKSTCFSMVRFGNVLDSSGSVIPTFKKQIKKGGPVTVTDKNIVRYFMTIPEAVELVIQAGAMGEGGDVFVLDMGKPIKIYDLAVKMIQLSGLDVLNETNLDGDVEIKFTGLRPGEKLYEELLVGENVVSTESKLIMRATEAMIEWKNLHPFLIELEKAALNQNQKDVRGLLQKIVPEFKPQSKIKD
jgi:FlaA1/EpsC-like NDP-sugar epimerase